MSHIGTRARFKVIASLDRLSLQAAESPVRDSAVMHDFESIKGFDVGYVVLDYLQV